MAAGYTVLITDPIKLQFLDAFRIRHGGISRVDVVKMALAEFMVNHPLDGTNGKHEQKLADAARLYQQIGELEPGVLQRHGVADSYRDAVGLITELVARGMMDAAKARNVVDMTSVTPGPSVQS